MARQISHGDIRLWREPVRGGFPFEALQCRMNPVPCGLTNGAGHCLPGQAGFAGCPGCALMFQTEVAAGIVLAEDAIIHIDG